MDPLSLFLQPPNPYNSFITHSSHPISNHETTESVQERESRQNFNHQHPPVLTIPGHNIQQQLVDHRTAQESNYGPPHGQTFYKSPSQPQQAPLVHNNNQNHHPSHFQNHPNYQILKPFQHSHHHHQPNNNHQQSNHYGPPIHQPRTIKYVSVFVAPPEPVYNNQPQRITIPGQSEKQVNIIFIKNPSSQNGPTAEVDLPPIPEQKTLVYVLNEKRTGAQNIKVNTPHQPKHHKPDVFFVQYKNSQQHHQQPTQSYGPTQQYSGPPQQNGHQNNFNYYSSSSSQATTVARNNHHHKDISSSYSDSNPEIQSTYAPSMSHETYNVLSKREIADKGTNSSTENNATSGSNYDFRPYRYGSNYDHNYYGVIGIKNHY